jgi:transposase-like protein
MLTGMYSELIERFERKQNPEIKGRMHVDEVFVEVRGRRCCVIHTVDSRTGYCPEAVLSERRDLEAYEGFFARLKKTPRGPDTRGTSRASAQPGLSSAFTGRS